MILARAAALLIPFAASAQDLSFGNAPTGAQVHEYLTRKKSDLAASSDAFVAEGRAWNVDPRLIITIAGAETTFAKHLCANNNVWNWFHNRTRTPSEFAKYDE